MPAGAVFKRRKSFLALEGLASLEDRERVPGRVLAVVGSPCADRRGLGLEGEYLQTAGCVERGVPDCSVVRLLVCPSLVLPGRPAVWGSRSVWGRNEPTRLAFCFEAEGQESPVWTLLLGGRS